MATDERTTGIRNEQYNVISVLYHALQGADTCATYLQDAERARAEDLVQFFREAQDMYRQLAERGKTLLWPRLSPPIEAPPGPDVPIVVKPKPQA